MPNKLNMSSLKAGQVSRLRQRWRRARSFCRPRREEPGLPVIEWQLLLPTGTSTNFGTAIIIITKSINAVKLQCSM